MGKIGFKFQAEQEAESKAKQRKEKVRAPAMIPGTASATIAEVAAKVKEHGDFIASKAFSKLRTKERKESLDAYNFLVRVMASFPE